MGKYVFILMVLFILNQEWIHSQSAGSGDREEYIRAYRHLAIREMNRSGIPASITLAQGLLESDNGNSRLARKANNHFGIKCHGWKGKKIYHDDDDKDECFRKYKTAEESYEDHTYFLMNSPRYAFLFQLDQTDYKGWANGLKQAGYATGPKYAKLLIQIIEESELYQYDRKTSKKTKKDKRIARVDVDEFEVEIPHRKILIRNRIEYIFVKEGDTYTSLSEELDLLPFELSKYNEITRDTKLEKGQVLYVQPKRDKASVEFKYHTVEEGETMYQISQMYGIKLKKLYQKNLMKEGTEPEIGQVIWLRKNKMHENK